MATIGYIFNHCVPGCTFSIDAIHSLTCKNAEFHLDESPQTFVCLPPVAMQELVCRYEVLSMYAIGMSTVM